MGGSDSAADWFAPPATAFFCHQFFCHAIGNAQPIALQVVSESRPSPCFLPDEWLWVALHVFSPLLPTPDGKLRKRGRCQNGLKQWADGQSPGESDARDASPSAPSHPQPFQDRLPARGNPPALVAAHLPPRPVGQLQIFIQIERQEALLRCWIRRGRPLGDGATRQRASADQMEGDGAEQRVNRPARGRELPRGEGGIGTQRGVHWRFCSVASPW